MRPQLFDFIHRLTEAPCNNSTISYKEESDKLVKLYQDERYSLRDLADILENDVTELLRFYRYEAEGYERDKGNEYWKSVHSSKMTLLYGVLICIIDRAAAMRVFLTDEYLQHHTESFGFCSIDIFKGVSFADYVRNEYKTKKPHLSPLNDVGGQLAGNGQNKPLEAEEMPINKDMLPTIGDEETKELEQRVFLKAIGAGFMSLNVDNNGYTWKQSNYDLAFMCGCIYWGDCAKEDKKEAYKSNFTKDCYYLKKRKGQIKRGVPERLKKLFSGKNVPDYRSHYNNLSQSPEWKEIDKFIKEAMAEVKAGK